MAGPWRLGLWTNVAVTFLDGMLGVLFTRTCRVAHQHALFNLIAAEPEIHEYYFCKSQFPYP